MSSDKCPWCGAEKTIKTLGCQYVTCGTFLADDGQQNRSVACLENELVQQRQRADDAERRLVEVTAERDRWKDEIDDVRVALVGGQLSDCVDESTVDLVRIVKQELAALKAAIATAPVGAVEGLHRGTCVISNVSGYVRNGTRVRLLPDPEVSNG